MTPPTQTTTLQSRWCRTDTEGLPARASQSRDAEGMKAFTPRDLGQVVWWFCASVSPVHNEVNYKPWGQGVRRIRWEDGDKHLLSPWGMSVFSTDFFFFLCFLGPHWWHMEVLRLGVKSKLQEPATPQPQQGRIWATPGTCPTAHSNAGSLPTEQGQRSNLHPYGY